MTSEATATQGTSFKPDYAALMEQILTLEGSSAGTYRRFHNYSSTNVGYLIMQGCPPEPIGTFKFWPTVNRYVKRGSKALSIIRPITVTRRDDDGAVEAQFTRYKSVRCIFPYSATDGEPLPEYEPPEWSPTRAMAALAIREVVYESMDGNSQGYSLARDIAINPVARFPLKTRTHEMAHVQHGHTTPEQAAETRLHRGLAEFQAEATAYLVLNEAGVTEPHWNPSESRSYVQHWLSGQQPPENAIKAVFKVTDQILAAGRVAVEGGDNAC